MAARFYHGGFGGLQVGQHVLPPNVTRSPSTASFGAAAVCDRNRVYVTTDMEAALVFACAHPSGRGKFYEVEPIGEVEPDPDAIAEGYSFQCEKARVVRVIRVKGKTIRNLQKALISDSRR